MDARISKALKVVREFRWGVATIILCIVISIIYTIIGIIILVVKTLGHE